MKRNYHMSMSRHGDTWSCDDCGESAVDVNDLRKTDCPVVTPPCKHCGGCEESNECKPDCKGCWAALTGKDVYVIGEEKG